MAFAAADFPFSVRTPLGPFSRLTARSNRRRNASPKGCPPNLPFRAKAPSDPPPPKRLRFPSCMACRPHYRERPLRVMIFRSPPVPVSRARDRFDADEPHRFPGASARPVFRPVEARLGFPRDEHQRRWPSVDDATGTNASFSRSHGNVSRRRVEGLRITPVWFLSQVRRTLGIHENKCR